MFEAVPRASTNQPDVFCFRMAIDQEISIPGVFVLADTRLNNGSVLQSRNVLLQVGAKTLDGWLTDHPVRAVGIKLRTVTVKGDLESALFNVGQRIWTVRMRVVQPRRHLGRAEAVVAGGGSEKKHLLTRWENAVA